MKFRTISLLVLGAVALAGCPKGGIPGVPGGAASEVDPNQCGSYASTDVGARLKGFLQATNSLHDTVMKSEGVLKSSCQTMAKELGISEEGSTADVCNRVSTTIKENLSVGLKAEATLTVDYKPAVCEVNVEVAAQAAAKCEGSASADVGATCNGTCNGTCDGTCEGGTGEGGQCNGTCNGTCSGSCDGHADVNASAECEAQASIAANADVQCTPAELTVEFDSSVVLDQGKVDMVVAALKSGMPKILTLQAKIQPIKAAAVVWAKSAKDLAKSAGKLYSDLGKEAQCVGAQLSAAAAMAGSLVGSVDMQVEVSVSVSASASASGGASAGS